MRGDGVVEMKIGMVWWYGDVRQVEKGMGIIWKVQR